MWRLESFGELWDAGRRGSVPGSEAGELGAGESGGILGVGATRGLRGPRGRVRGSEVG